MIISCLCFKYAASGHGCIPCCTRPSIGHMLNSLSPNMIACSVHSQTTPTPRGSKPSQRQGWKCSPGRMKERLNEGIPRRTDVLSVFSGRAALIRLTRAVLAEQHDE
jgi:Transposase, Mutator family